jgi:hypothetical protein
MNDARSNLDISRELGVGDFGARRSDT